MLLDRDGRAVAATDRNVLGSHPSAQSPILSTRMRAADATLFTVAARETNGFYRFTYSRRVERLASDALGRYRCRSGFAKV